MAKIINHQTTQVNFTLIPKKPINDVDTTKLKTKLSDIFENSKVIMTQFPEITILFDPNNQISVNILKDQNRIIIANNTVTPYSGRPLENFFKFIKESVDIINNNEIKDYGFNILSNLDLENGTIDSGDFIKENYIKKEKFDSLGMLKSAGLKVVYEKGAVRCELRIEPRIDSSLNPTKSIFLNLNSHYAGQSLPDLTTLQSQCQEIYNGLPGDIENIFSV